MVTIQPRRFIRMSCWIPALLWMALIFYSSSQPYQQQDMRPWLKDKIPEAPIVNCCSDVSIQYGTGEVSIETKGTAGFVEFFIRKAAHVFTFAVLGLLLYFAISQTVLRDGRAYLLAWFLSVLYAASDEFHQGLNPNRTPMIEDVLLDTVGITLALVCVFFVRRIVKITRSG